MCQDRALARVEVVTAVPVAQPHLPRIHLHLPMRSTSFSISWPAVAVALLAFGHGQLGAIDATVDIGSRRELFVDRLLVGEMKNVSLKLQVPQLMPPVTPPRPQGHYATVLNAGDKFQFYYRGDQQPGNTWKKGLEQYH